MCVLWICLGLCCSHSARGQKCGVHRTSSDELFHTEECGQADTSYIVHTYIWIVSYTDNILKLFGHFPTSVSCSSILCLLPEWCKQLTFSLSPSSLLHCSSPLSSLINVDIKSIISLFPSVLLSVCSDGIGGAREELWKGMASPGFSPRTLFLAAGAGLPMPPSPK